MPSLRFSGPATSSNLQAIPKYAVDRSSFWGRGIDGPLTVGNATFDITSAPPSPSPASPSRANYAACLQVSAIDGTNKILTTVGATTSRIFAGDHVLVINVQGSSGATTNVGKWERAIVASVTTNSITITQALKKTYGNASNSSLSGQSVVVQRLPEYTNVTVTHANAIITAPAFGGSSPVTVGVCAFLANNTLTGSAAGKIDMSGKGYRGGVAIAGTSSTGGPGESYDGQAATYTNSPGGCGGRVGGAGVTAVTAGLAASAGGGGAGGGAGSGGRHGGTVGTGGGNGGGGGGGQATNGVNAGGAGGNGGTLGGAGGTGNPFTANGGGGGDAASPATTPPTTYGSTHHTTITLGSGGGGVGAGRPGGDGGAASPTALPGVGGTSSGLGGAGGGGGASSTLSGNSGGSVSAVAPGVGAGGNGGGITLTFARNVTYGSAFQLTSGGNNGAAGQNGANGATAKTGGPSFDVGGAGAGGGGSGGAGGGSGGSSCLIAGNVIGGASMVITAATSTGGAGGTQGTGGPALANGGATANKGGDGGVGTAGGFGGVGRMYVGFFAADGVYGGASADAIGGYAPVAPAYKAAL